jgi:hypothetical protein
MQIEFVPTWRPLFFCVINYKDRRYLEMYEVLFHDDIMANVA